MVGIDYQTTRSDEFLYDAWVCSGGPRTKLSLTYYRHYRLVLGTVGYPLEQLRGTNELLSAGFDVYKGK